MRASMPPTVRLALAILFIGCTQPPASPMDAGRTAGTAKASGAPSSPAGSAPDGDGADVARSAAGGAASADVPSGAQPPMAEALRVVLGSAGAAPSAAETKARLATLYKEASAGERALLDRIGALMHKIEAITGEHGVAGSAAKLRPVIEELGNILREMRKLYPDDPGIQVQVAATLFTLPEVAATLGASDAARDEGLRAEAARIADQLVLRFPKDARVYGARGSMCMRRSSDPLPCIRDYATCQALDPTSACQRAYRELVRDYEGPYCEQADVRADFRMRRALPGNPKPGQELLEDNHETFAIDDVGALGKSDIVDVRASGPAAGRQVGEPEPDVPTVTVRFAKGRHAAIGAWTGEIASARGRVVVQSGGKRLRVARVLGGFTASMAMTEIPIEAACARVKRRALPRDLPRP
jgi:hypothetical protein